MHHMIMPPLPAGVWLFVVEFPHIPQTQNSFSEAMNTE